jgi:hypothetical protein
VRCDEGVASVQRAMLAGREEGKRGRGEGREGRGAGREEGEGSASESEEGEERVASVQQHGIDSCYLRWQKAHAPRFASPAYNALPPTTTLLPFPFSLLPACLPA